MTNIEGIKERTIDFFTSIGLEYTSLQVTEKADKIYIQVIPVENLAPLYIGFRGGNLNAMQHLLKSILWGDLLPKDSFLSLDIDFYREKNEKKVLEILHLKIKHLQETGDVQSMKALSPSDRRLVHLTVQEEFSGIIETDSFTNEEGVRVLKITKAEKK